MVVEDVPLMAKYKFKTTKRKSLEMSKVHSKGGKDELILRKLLWHKGIRYRVNVKDLPGKPDIVIPKYKIIVMVDGEFWHGKEDPNIVKNNKAFWTEKIKRNMERDLENTIELRDNGWTVLRFWESEIQTNLLDCVKVVLRALLKIN